MRSLLAVAPYLGLLSRPTVVLLVLIGLAFGLRRTALPKGARATTWLAIAVPLVAWFAFANWAALSGLYQTAPALRRIAIFAPPLLWLVVLLRSARMAQVLDAMPRWWLIALQVYRTLGAASLLLWAAGRLPALFALPAGIGDTLVGLLAIPVAVHVARGGAQWRLIGAAWNVLGLADFAVALSIGTVVVSGGFPPAFILIPTFMVPLSIVLHALSLWQLARSRTVEVPGRASRPAVSGAVSL